MQSAYRDWAIIGALVCSAIAGACSSPVSPSEFRTPAPPIVGSVTGSASPMTAQAAGLSPEALVDRGWDCRPVPFSLTRVSCSQPNQIHPGAIAGPPPPDDRPASIMVFVFDSGAFVGTNLLIRSDLYNDQECRATRAPYRFIARIGYYECLHQSQAD